jgi:hypothetical protein
VVLPADLVPLEVGRCFELPLPMLLSRAPNAGWQSLSKSGKQPRQALVDRHVRRRGKSHDGDKVGQAFGSNSNQVAFSVQAGR